MSKTFSTVLKVVLSVGLAVLVLYFVFRKIDLEAFLVKLKEVDYFWVILSMVISFFGYLMRAYRWQLQLKPLGYNPGTYRMFLAVMSGYLANLVIPRLGEVTRCGVLFKSDRVPVSTSFGTVITERVVDVLMLGVILLITLLVQSEQLSQFFSETLDTSINWQFIVVILLGLGAIGCWVFFKFIYPSQTKIGHFSRELIRGLISLKDVNLGQYILTTLGIWVVYFLMSFIVVFAIPETSGLSWLSGFSILTAGVVAFVLPVQSGFGTFHALVSTMLVFYGVDKVSGVFFASLLHTSQLIAVLIFGLVAMMLSFFVNKNGNENKNSVEK